MTTLQNRLAEMFPEPLPRGFKAQVASLCKVSPASVSNWFGNPEKVTTISRDSAETLINHFGLKVAPGWLAEGRPPKYPRKAEANVEPGPDTHGPYPLISEVQAGAWTELCDSLSPGDAEDWIRSTKNLGSCGYLLRVTGRSMENPGNRFHFPEGMILHVNPDLDPLPGQFVIVRRESTQEATFKRFVMLDGEPYLEAINPDWPKERKYLKLQKGDAWCGVVVDASLGGLP